MVVREWVPLDRMGSAKVGPKGQIVIPKAMRDRAGIRPGSTVGLVQADDGSISLRFKWHDADDMFEYFDRTFPPLPGMEGKTALDILHEMDAEDAEIERREEERWQSMRTSSMPTPSSGPTGANPSGRSSKGSSVRRAKARSTSV
ncbi:MAG: AbrB/MazE/SpoVT family DNA-binding domain-containing protein [Chloroflexota bacterium]